MKFYKAPFYEQSTLEELEEKDVHFPFSDKDATYIGLDHQYELTPAYFLERGVNLEEIIESNDPEKVKHFLHGLRGKVYTHIYANSKTERRILNYTIAKGDFHGYTPYEYRQAFLEAMFMEGVYLAYNGDISQVSGVDLDTMQNMSVDVMRNQERDWHRDAVKLLTQLGLNYYGRYRRIIPQGNDW